MIVLRLLFFLIAVLIVPHQDACSAEESSHVVVKASGVGKDAEGALKNALYRAVEQAVGSYVDQELVVKNDQVISDKILTVAKGFVESYREIVAPHVASNGSGLYECTIEARVKKNGARESLKAAGVSEIEIDGKSAWGAKVNRLRNREDALALLSKLLADLNRRLIVCSLVGDGKSFRFLEDAESGKSFIQIKISINVDNEWWNREAAPALDVIFGQLSIRDVPPLKQEMTLVPPHESFVREKIQSWRVFLNSSRELDRNAPNTKPKLDFFEQKLPTAKTYEGPKFASPIGASLRNPGAIFVYSSPEDQPDRLFRCQYFVPESINAQVGRILKELPSSNQSRFSINFVDEDERVIDRIRVNMPLFSYFKTDETNPNLGEIVNGHFLEKTWGVFTGAQMSEQFGRIFNVAFIGFPASGEMQRFVDPLKAPPAGKDALYRLSNPIERTITWPVNESTLQKMKTVKLEAGHWGVLKD